MRSHHTLILQIANHVLDYSYCMFVITSVLQKKVQLLQLNFDVLFLLKNITYGSLCLNLNCWPIYFWKDLFILPLCLSVKVAYQKCVILKRNEIYMRRQAFLFVSIRFLGAARFGGGGGFRTSQNNSSYCLPNSDSTCPWNKHKSPLALLFSEID
jgi:hypothetical protein